MLHKTKKCSPRYEAWVRSGRAMAEYSLGRLRSRGRAPPIQIRSFYLDESAVFGESSCSAYTGALVLRALGPSSFQMHRIDERFTRTAGNIFWAILLALVPGWHRLGFEGPQPQRQPQPPQPNPTAHSDNTRQPQLTATAASHSP